MVEGGSYWVVKHSSNICGNYDEDIKVMVQLRKVAQTEKCCIKIIVGDVLLYGITAEHLLAYFQTVIGVLKHHRATQKMKK